ncbi:MAG: hypothetical protein QW514_08990, partial [Thermoprotei archaeon]
MCAVPSDDVTRKVSEVVALVKQRGVRLVKFQWVGNDLIQRALTSTDEYLEQHIVYGIGVTRGMQSFNVLDLM